MTSKDKKELNLKELSIEELSQRLNDSTESLFKLRFRGASAPLKNTSQIRKMKRHIARLNTFINQRRQTA